MYQGENMSKESNETRKTEENLNENLLLPVPSDNDLKSFLVNYTGAKLNLEDEEGVTVNMIAEVLAADFPEFTFAFAEENFLRGYEVGLDDAYKTLTRAPEENTTE